jgi:hypothetical protein
MAADVPDVASQMAKMDLSESTDAKQQHSVVRDLPGTHLCHAILHALNTRYAPGGEHGSWTKSQKDVQMAILASRFPVLYGEDYKQHETAIRLYWDTAWPYCHNCVAIMKHGHGATTLVVAMIAVFMEFVRKDHIFVLCRSLREQHNLLEAIQLSPLGQREHLLYQNGTRVATRSATLTTCNPSERPPGVNAKWVVCDDFSAFTVQELSSALYPMGTLIGSSIFLVGPPRPDLEQHFGTPRLDLHLEDDPPPAWIQVATDRQKVLQLYASTS